MTTASATFTSLALLAGASMVLGHVPQASAARNAVTQEPIPLIEDHREYDLVGRLELLEDPLGQLTLEELLAGAGEGRWFMPANDDPTLGFSRSAYWGRLLVENPRATPVESVFLLRYPLLDHVEFYLQRTDGGYERHVSGDRLPLSVRGIRDRQILFMVPTAPGQKQWLYFRVDTDSSLQLGCRLFPRSHYIPLQASHQLLRGGYYGIMVAVTLYNLFLFLVIRSRGYLFYVLYVTSFALAQTALDGTAYRYFFPEWPAAGNTFVPVSIGVAHTLTIFFTQHFLHTSQILPRFHRVLIGYAGVNVLSAAIALVVPYSTAIRLITVLAFLTPLVCLVAGIAALRKGYRPARFYVVAFGALILGTFCYALVIVGVLPANAVTVNAQMVGSATEVLLLSFALADKISAIELEKEAARAEAIVLEKDLAITGAVQSMFLPKQSTFRGRELALAGFYRPATRCGGDWWWYEPQPDGRLLVFVGDVTGHGVGPAMVTAAVASAYRTVPAEVRGADVRQLLQILGARLYEICGGTYQMSIAALEVDPGRGRLALWTAGCPPVFILGQNGEITLLSKASNAMGDPEPNLGAVDHELAVGDRIFVFSDGLPEFVKANGKQLGYKGVQAMLRATVGAPTEEAREQLLTAFDRLVDSSPQHDDLTFVLVDYVGASRRMGPSSRGAEGIEP
jgi:serine phosphatase RsbU (regulator of sigma subunit)